VHSLIWHRDKFVADVFASEKLTNNYYATMKHYAKSFITRIKKTFPQYLVQAVAEKTPLEDADHLIGTSAKLTYRGGHYCVEPHRRPSDTAVEVRKR